MQIIKKHITVDIDWCSTGIWVKSTSGVWGNAEYSAYPIPQWLVERFEFWTDWYNSHSGENFAFEEEVWQALEAYKISLAIDLRRALSSEYIVHYWDNEREKHQVVEQLELENPEEA